jgi:phosphoglycerate dehydrogenase-like enzyme
VIVAAVQSPELAEEVGSIDGVELLVWPQDEELPARAEEVELVVPDYLRARRTARVLGRLPRLRAVQLQTAGYDAVLDLVPPGLDLLNARGVHDDATAELALGLTLASLRGLDVAVRETGHWRQDTTRRSLAESEVAILGYGSIGRAIAERMLACRARVTGVATSPRPDDLLGRVVTADEVDWAAQHVVVVVLPLTGSATMRWWSTSVGARCSTPTRCSPRRGVSASPSTSPTPSRCPTGIRCGRPPEC